MASLLGLMLPACSFLRYLTNLFSGCGNAYTLSLRAVLPSRADFFNLAEHESITTAAGLCNFLHLEVLMKTLGSEGSQYCDPWSNTTFETLETQLQHLQKNMISVHFARIACMDSHKTF